MPIYILTLLFLFLSGYGSALKADNRSQQLLQTMQAVLMAGDEAQALQAFFLEEGEADSIALYYMDLLPEASQTDSAQKYIKQLFLNRSQKAEDFLKSEYFGDLRYIQEHLSENEKKRNLHFYRIKANFVNSNSSRLIEIGAILINGRLKIIHAQPWQEN
jgi:hypothetical protein